jgi:hypothetical protein
MKKPVPDLKCGKWTRHCFGLIIGFCCLFIITVRPDAQTGISVTAEVDKANISTNESLVLTLTVAGNFQQLGEPQLPALTGFEVVSSSRSSQFSMVNGAVTSQSVFTYRLVPTTAGTLVIEPLAIVVSGSSYRTDPIAVQVTQGDAPTPTPISTAPGEGQLPSQATPSEMDGQDLYVEADVDNPSPFMGQQIVYRFRLYQAINLLNQPRLDWPVFSGFWTEDLVPNTVFERMINDRRYRVTEVRRALFPTMVGSIEIEPAVLTVPGDIFNRQTTLETNQVLVKVQPLPSGAPGAFTGAVGQFDITAWVEPVQTQVNEPVTLFVRISGAGNLNTLPDPTETIAGSTSAWRVYASQITTNVTQDGDVIRGEKLFERLLVPKQDGRLALPRPSLTFFDPQTSEYQTIVADSIEVTVNPNDRLASDSRPDLTEKQDIVLQASDIRHIKTAPPSLKLRSRPIIEHWLFWLAWILPVAPVMIAIVWDRRRRRLSSDVAYARAQRARPLAQKRLAHAQRQANLNQDTAYSAVAQALTGYIGDKFNLPPAGLTRDAIRQILIDRDVPDNLIQRILTFLQWADSGRFAPFAAGRDLDELVVQAETTITDLENVLDTTKE